MVEGDGFAAQLLDEAPDALIALSEEGRILSWSRGAEAIFGYPAAEAIGASHAALLVPPDEQEAARRARRDTLEHGAARLEATRRNRSSGAVHVDISMRLRSTAGAWFIAVNEKDITVLRRLRVQHASDARLRGLLDAAPDAMVVVGPDGLIQLVNGQAERLFR